MIMPGGVHPTLRTLSLAALGAVFVTLCAAAPGGCTNDGYPLDHTFHAQGVAPSAAPPPSTYAYRYPDVPPVLGAQDLRSLVGGFLDRVIVLDFWAGWSRRGREEMATVAHLQEELENEGLQVVSCNLDPPMEWSSKTVPILHAAKANFPCVVIPPAARPGLRAWLAPDWTYELPARFVLDHRGRVLFRAVGETPFSAVEQAARRHLLGGADVARGRETDRVSLRAKVIDCRTGRAESLPEIRTESADAGRLAEAVGDQVAGRLDRSANPRIAVAPFGSLRDRGRAGRLGRETAERVERALKDRGYYDVRPPARSLAAMEKAGVTLLAADFEPAQLKNRIDADYLVIGWIRGDQAAPATPAPGPPARVAVQEPLEEADPPPDEEETALKLDDEAEAP
jgi:thiol-disulfide isomerase/thioredoxin